MCKDCRNTFFDPVVYKEISNDKRCPFCGSERIIEKTEESAINLFK
jgi:predicted Zn-ribbon and HTH transcriptional regulator